MNIKPQRGVRAMRTKIFIGIIICIVIAGVAPPSFASYESSLRDYWKFDETSGTTAYASKGTDASLGAASWTPGKFGNALIPSSISQAMDPAPMSGTITIWVKPNLQNTYSLGIFGVYDETHGSNSIWNEYNDSSIANLYACMGNDTQYYKNIGTVPLNVWSHIAVTWNTVFDTWHYVSSGTVTVYNGSSSYSTNFVGYWDPPDASTPFFYIGGVMGIDGSNYYPYPFYQPMDDMALWEMQLTSAEITQVRNFGVEAFEFLLNDMSFDTDDMSQLYTAYSGQQSGVEIGGFTWNYYATDPDWVPSGMKVGDTYFDENVGYYIKLGSGMGGPLSGGGVPEPATVVGILVAVIAIGYRRIRIKV
ncbi:MAG: LamG domain-containing protein [Candidatus Omnitrophica bacterium]|nr:LamG domain-containing protein [Candidatus Omnitrophota bacterium]MCM8790530.1 LamG domain-containing protein [Candidatus Omnitrophota bacterium]